ncbi:MAG: hypothetical protein JXB23_08865 [Candidatus Aminicenantes bacterium]|nr:hypothetical protein [Candidatus Aminicenantes bacterium]
MAFFNSGFFKKYLMPGFVFQSVVIAGGYGTGRELVEYFLNNGPLGGLLGMFAITAVIWSTLLAVTFEFARTFRTYDYRSLFINLLGRFWFGFEILYFILLIIVLAVVGSAAGVLLRDNFGIPYLIGVAVVFAAIGFLAFKGSLMIEKFLSSVSICLYIVFGIFLLISALKFGPLIQQKFAEAIVKPDWVIGGFKYALYNIAVIPAVLFCIRGLETRKEALSAGLAAGMIGILPGFLILCALIAHYPEVLPEEVPVVFALSKLNVPIFLYFYLLVLFGALITTGIGFIHAVNERIQSAFETKNREFPQWARPFVAVGLLMTGLALSTFGLIDLIARGYGTTSYGVFLVYVFPMLTLGLCKIFRHRGSQREKQPYLKKD